MAGDKEIKEYKEKMEIKPCTISKKRTILIFLGEVFKRPLTAGEKCVLICIAMIILRFDIAKLREAFS